MAQVPIVEATYTGNGIQRVFDLPFTYLSASEVFVSVDGVDVPYSFLAGSTSSVQTTYPPAIGAAVRVYRNTAAVMPRHLFAGGVPFLPRYVDENAKQLLYALQEGINAFDGVLQSVLTERAQRIAADLEIRQDFTAADAALQAQITTGTPSTAERSAVVTWHDQVVQNSVNIPPNKNAWSAGPVITIATGQTVSIGLGSHWTIIEGAVQP